MPTFDILPLDEARANSATGQRAALLQEYMGYIQILAPGQAGKLEPGVGETTQAIRRRLNAAAETLGKELQVRRSPNAVYFWAPEAPRLGAGGPAPRPAPQEPGRLVLPPRFLDPARGPTGGAAAEAAFP